MGMSNLKKTLLRALNPSRGLNLLLLRLQGLTPLEALEALEAGNASLAAACEEVERLRDLPEALLRQEDMMRALIITSRGQRRLAAWAHKATAGAVAGLQFQGEFFEFLLERGGVEGWQDLRKASWEFQGRKDAEFFWEKAGEAWNFADNGVIEGDPLLR